MPVPSTVPTKASQTLAVLDAEVARRKARENLIDFVKAVDPQYQWPKHLKLIADALSKFSSGGLLDKNGAPYSRLAIFAPPRHGKTRLAAQLWVAHEIGKSDGSLDCIVASYSQKLSEMTSLAVKDIVNSPRWPFPSVRVRDDKYSVEQWMTKPGSGTINSISVRGGGSGLNAQLLVLDDIFADRAAADSQTIRDATWDWYSSVARTRLSNPSRQLLISTRWHDDDCAGRLLRSMPDDWFVLSFPALCIDPETDPVGRKRKGDALWPSRFPVQSLPSVAKGEMSSREFSCLYQQEPLPATGNEMQAEWFDARYDKLPTDFHKVIAAIDCSARTGAHNDWSVIVKIGVRLDSYYLLDVWRQKVQYQDLRRRILELPNEPYPPTAIYIEEASNGVAVIDDLKANSRLPIIGIRAVGSKQSRAAGMYGSLEAKKLILPVEAHWLNDYLREMLSFPAGHDDQVDATSLCMSQLVNLPFSNNWVIDVKGDLRYSDPAEQARYEAEEARKEAEEAAEMDALDNAIIAEIENEAVEEPSASVPVNVDDNYMPPRTELRLMSGHLESEIDAGRLRHEAEQAAIFEARRQRLEEIKRLQREGKYP